VNRHQDVVDKKCEVHLRVGILLSTQHASAVAPFATAVRSLTHPPPAQPQLQG
jgi:hypothetical protein